MFLYAEGTPVTSRRFRWKKLPIGMQVELARACGLDTIDAAEALKQRFREPPKAWIVKDFWLPADAYPGLRDGWLGEDERSRKTIVRQLRERNLGDANRRTRSKSGDLRYLRTCNMSGSLREVVLNRIIDSGRDGSATEEGGESEDLAQRYRPFWTIDTSKTPAVDDPPYPHQIDAWNVLSNHEKPLAGIIVLPTGAGKTRTATEWILKNVLSDPNPRVVLWIAHRAELLQQAAESFIKHAHSANREHPLRIRVISSAHRSRVSTLVHHADVVLVTVQSLARRKDLVEAFFKDHPDAFVVIDEAHHAAARSYREIIASMRTNGTKCDLLGLTATPTRTAEEEVGVLFGVFPQRVLHQTTRRELIQSGILSRPIVEAVHTHEDFEADFTAKEWKFVRQYDDLSQQSLQRIAASTSRNRLIVKRYTDHKSNYGKTLVFAANIAHCYTLAKAFQDAGVKADYVASRRHDDHDEPAILDQYRTGDLEVLVSVGKLTEGFDAPKTQTVFLARPTGSQILLKQMIGRGMRGVDAGGYDTVRIVSFRDHWRKFPHLWEPEEVFDGEVGSGDDTDTRRATRETVSEPWNLYEKLAETAVAQIEPPPNGPAVGWYDLQIGDLAGIVDTAILVWEHQRPGFDAMIADAAHVRTGRPLSYFDDIQDPLPDNGDLKTFAKFLREVGVPVFVEFVDRSKYAPRSVAESLKGTDLESLSNAIRAIYEMYPAAQAEYDSFERYSTAVIDAADQRFAATREFDDSLPHLLDLRKEVPPGNHDLSRLLSETVAEYKQLLAAVPGARRLDPLPPVRWGSQRSASNWAFHRSHGKASGCTIVINPILQTKAITAETLRFLLFHELLHHVMGNSHKSPFRKFEHRFSGYERADAELDSFADRYKVKFTRRRSADEGK